MLNYLEGLVRAWIVIHRSVSNDDETSSQHLCKRWYLFQSSTAFRWCLLCHLISPGWWAITKMRLRRYLLNNKKLARFIQLFLNVTLFLCHSLHWKTMNRTQHNKPTKVFTCRTHSTSTRLGIHPPDQKTSARFTWLSFNVIHCIERQWIQNTS